MILFVLFLLRVTNLIFIVAVQINYIKVPSAVRNNTHKPIILDCNYSVRPDDTDLVVKWLLNEEIVYQWIPPKKPQSLGCLKNRIDINYAATEDPKTVHRAMKIMNPTTDIAGEYKCFVSTFADEDFSGKNMVVFEPEKALTMIKSRPGKTKINFTCIASEVYPKPKIALYRDRKDDFITRNILEPIEWDTVKHDDGRYTTFMTSIAKLEDLIEGDLINCDLRIPSTGYVKKKSLLYYPTDRGIKNGAPNMQQLNVFFITFCIFLKFYYN